MTALIAQSVMVLQAGDYSDAQRRAALGTVFGVDTQLIRDQTYLVIENGADIIACGGWSYRRTLYGADALAGREDNVLDPETDAARIRAFFVHPDWTRRGLGGQILKACEAAAIRAGFRRFEMGATLTGVPLYRAFGYVPIEATEAPLSDGLTLPIIRMGRSL
ncbi:GNAT family N-acetyltransferase [Asticcacaulis sp. 201]|uniref:GNAT family N-acetyltransferase n=1 Tax=Asticcacaulis sp. 201 TaxID=3028787 RepID=UPI002916027E|nr:GNAT family N-acetyltransferase [Asticcacaulis sp. 201]MDV6332726.1 GNAT family N-acetyltransferase [Asticcacaulis sp. 201]